MNRDGLIRAGLISPDCSGVFRGQAEPLRAIACGFVSLRNDSVFGRSPEANVPHGSLGALWSYPGTYCTKSRSSSLLLRGLHSRDRTLIIGDVGLAK
jgi:hypothetical protein